MDATTMHRTERGSAGSVSGKGVVDEIDPALPRSVLCMGRLWNSICLNYLSTTVLYKYRTECVDYYG
jgi:hypothetical protein